MPSVSVYLTSQALSKLDAQVAEQARKDKAAGLSGRQISTRSSYLEKLIENDAVKTGTLTREAIEYSVVSLAQEYGAKKVSLFGSFARGEETSESDVDILLEKGDIKGMKVLEFESELAKRLGRKVDVITTAGASERFLNKIRKDEVVLYAAS